MDPRLQQAAESGKTSELYALIEEDPYILENFGAVPFINTPLHVAAASGNGPFAMEMLNLKPSFAKKLNTGGHSPLHLAVEKNQRRFVSRMIWHDRSLARVKGRNGITPFLLLVIRGNAELVTECLYASPGCIEDVSVELHSALHLAVRSDRFEVLQVLTGWIQRMSQKNAITIEIGVLNIWDYSYNTALHLATYKNDHQAVKLLLECRMVDRNKLNGAGLTFLDILRNLEPSAAGGDLDLEQVVLQTGCEEVALVPKSKARSGLLKSPFTFWTYWSTEIRRLRSSISDEARGLFLIVCTLIITATYQTALQPPRGVHQSEDENAGSVVMKQTFFILLWVSNTVGFCCSVFYTFCLIPRNALFTSWFLWIGTSLCFSYALAMAIISPHPLVFLSATFAFFLLFALYIFLEFFLKHWRGHQKIAFDNRIRLFFFRKVRGN